MLKSLGKLALAAPLVLTACVEDAGLPDLGPCSSPPDQDLFEYGQIDVGTCIASPADLQIRPDPQSPDNHFLTVVNSNAYSNFTGSSLLMIDASSIDLTCPVNGMHELSAFATGMQEFAGRLAVDEARGLGLLSARVNGQMDGDLTDVVFTLDMTDPRAIGFSDAGPRQWGPFRYVQVPADPWSVRVNPANGRAYVLGLTNHSVSALDLISDPIQFLDLRGDLTVGSASFTDADGSGSAPDFSIQSVVASELQDEVITLTFQEGTTRLFFATDDGDALILRAANSGDGVNFVEQAGGALVEPDAAITWATGGLSGAAVGFLGDGLSALVTGVDASGKRSIGRMSAADHALDWTVSGTQAIAPSQSGALWDTTGTFDPDWFIDAGGTVQAYFAGGPGWGTAIGHAEGAGLGSLTRVGDAALVDGADGMVLAASDVTGDWDAAAVFGPAVIVDGASGDTRLFYSGHDGVAIGDLPGRPAIGLATSPDGLAFTRLGVVLESGDAGAWDGLGVAWPTVFFDNGRWQLWYRGYDGVSWRVGRATSFDGTSWDKDPRNPISGAFFEVADGAPLRVFAQKVSPVSGYQLTGEITGDLPFLASEGTAYEAGASPVGFLVVGGQALGRGVPDSYDRDGAAAAGRVGSTDSIVYAGWQGSRTRLALATDQGAGAGRVGAFVGAGWTAALEGLNGETPSLSVHEPDVQLDGADLVVAFSTSAGIGIGTLTLDAADAPVSFAPLAPAVVLGVGAEGAFDSGGISAPALLLGGHDGNARLAYAGTRGEAASIGIATAPSAVGPYTRSDTESFPRGSAGAWDDASITSPTLLWDAEDALYRLWYLGSDGGVFRLGMATSADGLAWTRHADAAGVTQPVFDGVGLPFVGSEGLHTARVRALDDGRFELWFEGRLDGVPRIGRALSADGLSWATLTNPTTAGDTFTLETRRGDSDASTGIALGEPPKQGEAADAILLVDGFRIHGAGVSELILSPDGQFGVVANKRTNVVTILDLRDDSTDDWTDANANGVEAVIRIPQRYGIVGTRDMAFSPDGTKLYALMAPLVFSESGDGELRTGTEGLITIDWTLVEDTASGTLLFDDAIVSWAPLARGREEDAGYRSDVSVGPSALALSADGSRAYVTNYNDNSLWILNLNAGARGAVIERVGPLDEAPSEVVLSPDGRLAYVANYIGWSRNIVTHSTIQVIDVDEDSATFGEVLTTLTNIESRSDRGCP